MPFADDGSVIIGGFQDLGDQDGMRGEEAPVVFDMGADDAGDADEIGIATGQERRAGWGADGTIGVEVIQAHSLSH